MWTPFAHQPSRVQPVQARPSSNPSIFSAPSLLSCRAGAPAGVRACRRAGVQACGRVEKLPSVPLLCPILPASARASAHASSCFGLRLVEGAGPLVGNAAHPTLPSLASDYERLRSSHSLSAPQTSFFVNTERPGCLLYHGQISPSSWQPTSKVDSTCRTALLIACLLAQASTMSSQCSSNLHPDPRFRAVTAS